VLYTIRQAPKHPFQVRFRGHARLSRYRPACCEISLTGGRLRIGSCSFSHPEFVDGRQPHNRSPDVARATSARTVHPLASNISSQPITVCKAVGSLEHFRLDASLTRLYTRLVTSSSPGKPSVRFCPLMGLPLLSLNHHRPIRIQGTDRADNFLSSRKNIGWSVCLKFR
jgi:hypothetical protein